MNTMNKFDNKKSADSIETILPIVLGFDPGTNITGWGVVIKGRPPRMLGCGAIRTRRETPMETRINHIYSSVKELIQQYHPSAIAIEEPFYGVNAASAIALVRIGGILMLAAEQESIPLACYPPRTVKSSVVGRGSATKEQVQYMIQRLLHLNSPPKPLDASDALAVAWCHLSRHFSP